MWMGIVNIVIGVFLAALGVWRLWWLEDVGPSSWSIAFVAGGAGAVSLGIYQWLRQRHVYDGGESM